MLKSKEKEDTDTTSDSDEEQIQFKPHQLRFLTEAAPASSISAIAFVTKSEWSREDLEFLSWRANGGSLSHTVS